MEIVALEMKPDQAIDYNLFLKNSVSDIMLSLLSSQFNSKRNHQNSSTCLEMKPDQAIDNKIILWLGADSSEPFCYLWLGLVSFLSFCHKIGFLLRDKLVSTHT